MRIGFIGAGKVGTTMARYFASKKYTISGFYSRSFKHATASASQINSQAFNRLAECIEASDWLFLTVPDDRYSQE